MTHPRSKNNRAAAQGKGAGIKSRTPSLKGVEQNARLRRSGVVSAVGVSRAEQEKLEWLRRASEATSCCHTLEQEQLALRDLVRAEVRRWGRKLPPATLEDIEGDAVECLVAMLSRGGDKATTLARLRTQIHSSIRKAKHAIERERPSSLRPEAAASVPVAPRPEVASAAACDPETLLVAKETLTTASRSAKRPRASGATYVDPPASTARELATDLEFHQRAIRQSIADGSIHAGSQLREGSFSEANEEQLRLADHCERERYGALVDDIARHCGVAVAQANVVAQLVEFRERIIVMRCEECAPGVRWVECEHTLPRFEDGVQVGGTDLRDQGRRGLRLPLEFRFGGLAPNVPGANYNADYVANDGAGRLVRGAAPLRRQPRGSAHPSAAARPRRDARDSLGSKGL